MILQLYSIGGRTGYFRSVRYMKDPLLRQFWPRRIFVLSQVLPKREDIAILARISRHLVLRHNRGWVITKKKKYPKVNKTILSKASVLFVHHCDREGQNFFVASSTSAICFRFSHWKRIEPPLLLKETDVHIRYSIHTT